MTTPDIKYDILPFDGTPGEKYEFFEERLLNIAARADDRGWSLADHLLGTDEGGPTGPAVVGGPGAAKAQQSYRKRAKESYALLTKHIVDAEYVTQMRTNHFQDGYAAFQFLRAQCNTVVDQLKLRDLNAMWESIDILADVGVSENTVAQLGKRIRTMNGKRPVANRKSQDEMTEKMLECLFSSSKHFHESATLEYNAPAGQRQFEHAAGMLAGQRDFNACESHFNALWRSAVRAKLAGFTPRAPTPRAASSNRQTLEQGLLGGQTGREPPSSALSGGAALNASLTELAHLGSEEAGYRGTLTTSDWSALNHDELQAAAEEGTLNESFDTAYMSDSRGTRSIEIICDRCRGLGHIAVNCPSPDRYRSIQFAIGILQAKLRQLPPPRRAPPRGQVGPFKPQPRNFRRYDRRPPPRARVSEEGEDDETTDAEHESQNELARTADEMKMPTAFSLSDDQLFEREQSNIAVEVETTKPDHQMLVGKITAILLAAIIAILIVTEQITRAIGTALIILAFTVGFSPRVHGLETAYAGNEAGMIAMSGGQRVCVDSGCTSTSIPPSMSHLLHTITDHSPTQRLFIANDAGLPILKVGKMNLPTTGRRLLDDGTQGPPEPAHIPVSRALVVEGLGSTMLLSVKGMKRDGVNTYLNDDNSIHQSDCLLIRSSKMVVPFATGSSYCITTPEAAKAGISSDDDPLRRIRPSEQRPFRLIHNALSHVGTQRLKSSNITIDGQSLSELKHDELTCPGCRLGNTGANHTPHRRRYTTGQSTSGFTHFGQQVETDICTGFEASFPHGFTCMINFSDRYTHKQSVYFMVRMNASETKSSAQAFHSDNYTRLKDGIIGRWVTDNGKMFLGEEVDAWASETCSDRGFQVPNDSDTLPVPERMWGTMQRMMRSDLAQASAPRCLWPWGAAQTVRLLYYLPTNAHNPPQSPYQFIEKNAGPVDLTWARTMYCDVTVTVPHRDREGKLGDRGADGCHLGYDSRRHSHFVFVPSLKRLSSFTVREWRENSFEQCKQITADTPVEFFDAIDLPTSTVTASSVPRRFTARAGRERSTILLLFCGLSRDGDIAQGLRGIGHTVITYDLATNGDHDMSRPELQSKILNLIGNVSFVFLSPPCKTASIAFDPPLRSKQYPSGVEGLSPKHQKLVDDANVLFKFAARVIKQCNLLSVSYCIESAASRRFGPAKCQWGKFANHGFLWDFPEIVDPDSSTYLCFAQCSFGTPYQKYTGLLVDNRSAPSFRRIFGSADCTCASHTVVLRGHDESGTARTSIAEGYPPRLCSAFVTAIADVVSPVQTGFGAQLNALGDVELASAAADAHDRECIVCGGTGCGACVYKGYMDSQPIEIWSENAEGAFRVSEMGEVPVPKTLEEAKGLKWWPIFKKAMEDEITGKLANNAWVVVKRPVGARVLKSKWVYTVKYNDDGSIQLVKARFVACGYSQTEGSDFNKVFAATLPGVSFRILCALIALECLLTDHVDAVKAFTQSDIDHLIYVEMPEGFGVSGYVLKLLKALEGIKQGAYLWFQHNKAAWERLGFSSWANEPNLYRHPTLGIRVGIFADDILVGFPEKHKADYINIKRAYAKLIKIDSVEISPVLKFTGVQISRNMAEGTLTIRQHRYIEQLANEYKGEFEEQETPFGVSKEARHKFDNLVPAPEGSEFDKGKYLQLIGKLVWPTTMTRVDAAFAVNTLARFVHSPSAEHYQYALKVLGYLSATRHMGITYGGRTKIPLGLSNYPVGFESSHGLYCVHDSSWGTRPRPMGGFVIMFLNGAVDWNAGNIKLVPHSSHEAESAIASRAARAVAFVRELLRSNGSPVTAATPALGDNKALFTSIQQEGATSRTRYYERAIMLIKRAVLLRLLAPFLVGTDQMIADMFTKAVEKASFFTYRNEMMNAHHTLRDRLEKGLVCAAGATRRLMAALIRKL